MGEIAKDELNGPWPLYGCAMRLAGDRWEDFMVPANHRAFKPLKAARTVTEAGIYRRQVARLQQTDSAFHASLMVIADNTSICCWTDGMAPATLPRADKVTFVRIEGDSGVILGEAPWERLQAVMGPMMIPMGMTPERWRVEMFPTEGQLRQMRLEDPKPANDRQRMRSSHS